MSSDLPGGDAVHEVTAAVLAVTPLWDGDGLIGTEIERTEYMPDEPIDPSVPDEYDVPVYGDPTPIAARQAAAVLRWAARTMPEQWSHEHAMKWLRTRADEIDPKEARDDRRRRDPGPADHLG